MYLMHYGTKNMRWGVRKYQNEDGTLTDAGKQRYRNHEGLGRNRNPDTSGSVTSYHTNRSTKQNARNHMSDSRFYKVGPDGNKYLTAAGADRVEAAYGINTPSSIRNNQYRINLATELLNTQIKHDNYNEWKNKPSIEEQKFAGRDAQLKHDTIVNYTKNIVNASSGMPTSAIKAKQKAENEAKVKVNIPASAWNQRVNSIHTSKSTNKKSPAKGEYGAIQKKNDAMKTSAQYRKETEMHKAMADLYGRNANKKANQASHPTFNAYDRQHGWKIKK